MKPFLSKALTPFLIILQIAPLQTWAIGPATRTQPTRTVPIGSNRPTTAPQSRDSGRAQPNTFRFDVNATNQALGPIFNSFSRQCGNGANLQTASIECLNAVSLSAAASSVDASRNAIRLLPPELRIQIRRDCLSGNTQDVALCRYNTINRIKSAVAAADPIALARIVGSRGSGQTDLSNYMSAVCRGNNGRGDLYEGDELESCVALALDRLQQNIETAKTQAGISLNSIRVIGMLAPQCASKAGANANQCAFNRSEQWNSRVFFQDNWNELQYVSAADINRRNANSSSHASSSRPQRPQRPQQAPATHANAGAGAGAADDAGAAGAATASSSGSQAIQRPSQVNAQGSAEGTGTGRVGEGNFGGTQGTGTDARVGGGTNTGTMRLSVDQARDGKAPVQGQVATNQVGTPPENNSDRNNRTFGHANGRLGLPPSPLLRAFSGLINSSTIQGSNPLNCPSYIPQSYCTGGRFDPTLVVGRLRSQAAQRARNATDDYDPDLAVTQSRPTSVGAGSVPDDTLSSLVSASYNAVEQDFTNSVRDFLLENYVEGYFNTAGINHTGASGKWVSDDMINSVVRSCRGSRNDSIPGFNSMVARLASQANQIPVPNNAASNYAQELAAASQCIAHLVPRMQTLNQVMGLHERQVLDPALAQAGEHAQQSTAGIVGHTAVMSAISMIPAMPAFVYIMNRTPTATFWRGANAECSTTRLLSDGGSLVEDRGTIGGSNSSPIRLERHRYCSIVASEFLQIQSELESLYRNYPTLVENTSGTKLYETIASAGPRPQAVTRYSHSGFRDPSRDPEQELLGQAPSGQRSCMALMKKNNPASNGQESQSTSYDVRLGSNTHPSVARAQNLVDSFRRDLHSGVNRSEQAILDRIKSICENPDRAVNALLSAPDSRLMENFFNCSRPTFTSIRRTAQQDANTGIQALSNAECRDRRSSSWVACEMNRRNSARNDLKQMGGEIIDLLFTAQGARDTVISPQALTLRRASLAGGAMGGAFDAANSYVLQGDDTRHQAISDRADFFTGNGTREAYENAVRELRRWQGVDPRVTSALSNAVIGAVTVNLEDLHGNSHPDAHTIREAQAQRARIEMENLFDAVDRRVAEERASTNQPNSPALDHALRARDSIARFLLEQAANDNQRPERERSFYRQALRSNPESRIAFARDLVRGPAHDTPTLTRSFAEAVMPSSQLDQYGPPGSPGRTAVENHMAQVRAAIGNDPTLLEKTRNLMHRLASSDPEERRRALDELREKLNRCGTRG